MEGISMRNLINSAIGAAMTSLFAVMFWGQVVLIATAVALAKTGTYAVASKPYLPMQMFEAVY
jgi:hypothetical protein